MTLTQDKEIHDKGNDIYDETRWDSRKKQEYSRC